jgi:hypothetical protein
MALSALAPSAHTTHVSPALSCHVAVPRNPSPHPANHYSARPRAGRLAFHSTSPQETREMTSARIECWSVYFRRAPALRKEPFMEKWARMSSGTMMSGMVIRPAAVGSQSSCSISGSVPAAFAEAR